MANNARFATLFIYIVVIRSVLSAWWGRDDQRFASVALVQVYSSTTVVLNGSEVRRWRVNGTNMYVEVRTQIIWEELGDEAAAISISALKKCAGEKQKKRYSLFNAIVIHLRLKCDFWRGSLWHTSYGTWAPMTVGKVRGS